MRIYIGSTGIEVSLANADDNRETLFQCDGKKTQAVTLTGRTLYKDGNWNTLCLPFDLTISGSQLDGDGVDVRTLESSTFEDGTLTLTFTEAGAVTQIEAGKPYLIKWNDTGATLTGNDPVFNSLTIHNNLADASTDYIDFIGTYSPVSIYQADDKTKLYLGDDNKLYYPTDENFKVNACRGYFQLKNGLTAGEPIKGARPVRAFTLSFAEDPSTQGVTTPLANRRVVGSATFYTLDGSQLSGKPTTKGLYIMAKR